MRTIGDFGRGAEQGEADRLGLVLLTLLHLKKIIIIPCDYDKEPRNDSRPTPTAPPHTQFCDFKGSCSSESREVVCVDACAASGVSVSLWNQLSQVWKIKKLNYVSTAARSAARQQSRAQSTNNSIRVSPRPNTGLRSLLHPLLRM